MGNVTVLRYDELLNSSDHQDDARISASPARHDVIEKVDRIPILSTLAEPTRQDPWLVALNVSLPYEHVSPTLQPVPRTAIQHTHADPRGSSVAFRQFPVMPIEDRTMEATLLARNEPDKVGEVTASLP